MHILSVGPAYLYIFFIIIQTGPAGSEFSFLTLLIGQGHKIVVSCDFYFIVYPFTMFKDINGDTKKQITLEAFFLFLFHLRL